MNYKVGLTGNYYLTSSNRNALELICKSLDKSINSIYWNEKYQTFAIRIKSNKHKERCKELYNKNNYK